MNKFLDNIFDDTRQCSNNIILPETDDERVKIAESKLQEIGIGFFNNACTEYESAHYFEYLLRLKFTRNWTSQMIDEYLQNPLNLATLKVALKEVEGMIAGATVHQEKIIRTAVRVIGMREKAKFIFSSTMIAAAADCHSVFTFADCSIIPEPKPDQLAMIAGESAKFHQSITKTEPLVAFSSFSTLGDFDHYRVERVRQAMRIFARKYPEIKFEGELQLDAAINPRAAKLKIQNSALGGKANVLIFPNLDAGNIALKILTSLGNYVALGTVVHGLKGTVNLVSRACTTEDIVNTAVLTSLG